MGATGSDRTGADVVALLFDRESDVYDRAHDGPGGHLLEARMAAVLEFVGAGPGRLLDAGMGPGRLLEVLAKRGWTVFGIDISERMVELAAARLSMAGERLLQGDMTDLPFAEATFDAVVATGVIEYLDNPSAGISELLRVLRPGGLAVVSMPNVYALQARWTSLIWNPGVRAVKRLAPALSRPSPYKKPGLMGAANLVQAMRNAGAEPVALRYAGMYALPVPFNRIAPRLDIRMTKSLEERPSDLSRAFATQLLLSARKSGRTQPALRS